MCPCPVQNVVLCVNAKGECFVFDVADQVGEVVRAAVVAVGGVVCAGGLMCVCVCVCTL